MSKANYDFTAGTAAASWHVFPHPGAYASDVCIVRVVHQPGTKGTSDTPSIQVPNWKGKKTTKIDSTSIRVVFCVPSLLGLKNHPVIRRPSKLSTWQVINFWTNVAVDSRMRCKIGVNTSRICIKMDENGHNLWFSALRASKFKPYGIIVTGVIR